MKLEVVYKFIEAKEAGRRSASRLLDLGERKPPQVHTIERETLIWQKTRKILIIKLICVVTVVKRGTAKTPYLRSGRRNGQLSDIVATTVTVKTTLILYVEVVKIKPTKSETERGNRKCCTLVSLSLSR